MNTVFDWVFGFIAMAAFALMIDMAITGTTFTELFETIKCYM